MPLPKHFFIQLLLPFALILLSSGIARGQIEAEVVVGGNDRLLISFSGTATGPLPENPAEITIVLGPINADCSPPNDGFGVWLAPAFGARIIASMSESEDGYTFNVFGLGEVFGGSVDLAVGEAFEGTVNFDLFHDSFFFETRHCLEPGMTFDVFWGRESGQGAFQSSGVTVATPPAPTILGDVNTDGAVDFLDIPSFIAVLQSGEFQAEADCDQNEEVNFADIVPFIDILSSQ